MCVSVIVMRGWSFNFILILRLNWSYFVNNAIIGTCKIPVSNVRVDPSSCSWILTYHSPPGKFGRDTSSLALAGDHSLECKTWKQSCEVTAVDPEKKQTISRAAYLLVASRATFAGRILARSPARPHYHSRIHGSRGKYNHHLFRKRVRHRCRGAHAATTIVTVTMSHRQLNKDMPVQPQLKLQV